MMNEWENAAREIFESLFNQTRDFVGKVLDSKENFMDCLFDYYRQAWKVPKEYKGNSSGLGFVPEFLIFEIVKQNLERKHGITFRPKEKTISGTQINTYSFVDNRADPHRLLAQGLKFNESKSGFRNTDCQHDITYQVKEGEWRNKAIIEVKGFVDFPSLRSDFKKLQTAEFNNNDCLFAFVGFNISGAYSEESKEAIRLFINEKNHYFISPEGESLGVDVSSLNTFLEDLL